MNELFVVDQSDYCIFFSYLEHIEHIEDTLLTVRTGIFERKGVEEVVGYL